MQNIVLRAKNWVAKGHERSVKAKTNVLASFLYRGLSVALSLLFVPIVLDYLDPTRYGTWLTITSIAGWVGLLDIGLGNGLRNKFANALAKEDKEAARTYVSTTYVVLSLLFGLVFILFMIINPFLNWASILNASPDMAKELSALAIIVFGSFCLLFVSQLITVILVADQRPSLVELINLIGKALILLIIYALPRRTSGSLLYFGITFSAAPVVLLIAASIFFYMRDYREFIPSIRYVNFEYAKELVHLGVKFFIIQIAVVIVFTTDNVIIAQLYDPSYVTPYHIAHKYFGIMIMAFTIIIRPFWSAVTEASHKDEIGWITNAIKKLLYIWVGLVGITVLMVVVSGWFYGIWIGNRVNIPLDLSIGMALFAVISTWNNIFAYFINGVGKIKLQLYACIFISVVNIPLSIVFAKYLNLGPVGVILATCACLLIGSILNPIQYYKIIKNRAKGIWAQ